MSAKITKGIDCSRWQGEINWEEVAKDGISFAMIKATQGEGIQARDGVHFTDSKFNDNITGAYAAGLSCGAYHFSTAANLSEAKKEFDYFFNVIKPHKQKINLYAAIDFEDVGYTDIKRIKLNTGIVLLFADMAKANGFTSALYTNRNFLTDYLDKARLEGIAIWQAHYYTPRCDQNPPQDSDSLCYVAVERKRQGEGHRH
ncbi:MAG: hypothetical protein A2Y17_04735 [Clostridiales bacterium GWF2_38_85]|nr:MAG: hypothetical protein A2Y17_04735 [Clostridiales bacterium GWF2_38_85]HBL84406.1 hypothetical protein [Clostridiales bacterium]